MTPSDEPLVARDIDDPEDAAVGEGQRGEPEFDRDPPPFLLLEPVGVHAGETLDQRRLAVIHVAGRAHHDMLHTPESSRLIRFSQQVKNACNRRDQDRGQTAREP
jgi:hypothetical protein